MKRTTMLCLGSESLRDGLVPDLSMLEHKCRQQVRVPVRGRELPLLPYIFSSSLPKVVSQTKRLRSLSTYDTRERKYYFLCRILYGYSISSSLQPYIESQYSHGHEMRIRYAPEMTTTTATAPSIPSPESSTTTTTTPSPAEQNVPEVVSQSPASEPRSKPLLIMKEDEPEKKNISRSSSTSRPDPTSTTSTTESTTVVNNQTESKSMESVSLADRQETLNQTDLQLELEQRQEEEEQKGM